MALPDMQRYCLESQLSQVWTLRYSVKEEALYQLWQEVLQTELPPIHALETTNPGSTQLSESSVVEVFKQEQTGHKITMFYRVLMTPIKQRCPLKVRDRWETNIEQISDDQWNHEEGTLLHSFWSCSKIKPYWLAIQEKITKLLGFEITLDPKWYLMGMDPPNQLTRPAKSYLNCCSRPADL
ncbi:hypothetical protein XELAEV_18020498mg [Xenopus laevis]|uniref:Uncharacterized protein n=1 Tax=Xenopus laevis TaxID=8355 RepID=A0A974HQP3_XENLA|nr:hypothetical protein XELAEV_18020498mg [Xenopus laevis]